MLNVELNKNKIKGSFTLPQLQNHFGGNVSINKIDLTDFENRDLTNEDKIKILNTIDQLTKLLKQSL